MDHLDVLQKKGQEGTTKAKKLAKVCEKHGLKVKEIYEGDIDVDAGVELEGGFDIQIDLDGFYLLNRDNNDGTRSMGIEQARNAEEIATVTAIIMKKKTKKGRRQ